MSLRTIAGVLNSSAVIVAPPPDDDVNLNFEDFSQNFGLWTTPGTIDPQDAWTRTSLATPTASAGPNGGSNPADRSVQSGNFYVYTEASVLSESPWSLESPLLDASLGEITLTFDVHMRFGSVGGITTGTLQVQGFNGSSYVNIGSAIVGSQQTDGNSAYRPSTDFGAFTSQGFSNSDFRFRFLFTRGDASSVNFDCAIDNVDLVGPAGALDATAPPSTGAREAAFNTGLRRLHVSQTGAAPLDGSTPDLSFTSLQAALDAAIAGDVITIGAGDYTGSFDLTNIAGSVAEPVWVAAEVIGDAVISNYLPATKAGTVSWRDDGNGVFSIAGSRPYSGFDIDGEQFLPGYRSVGDITANSIPTTLGPNNPSGSILKPQRGFGFSGGRISLRLDGGTNPNGRRIALTNGFGLQQMSLNNADNVIIDGLFFEGAGDNFALDIASNCANVQVRNCVFDGCQFGIRTNADDTLIQDCEYLTSGIGGFALELRALNGAGTTAAFRYAKNYYTASIVGGSDFDALLEGGLDTDVFATANPAENVIIEDCYMHDCFEGSKAGRHLGAIVRRCAFENVLDDGIEWETPDTGGLGLSGTGETSDCLFLNCQVAISYQGSFITQEHFCYRNVIVIDDLDFVEPPFLIKMINTPGGVDIHMYHNTMINVASNANSNDGFGNNHWVWFGFSNSTANRIRNFYNNIVSFPNDLDAFSQAGDLPNSRENNVVVSPADNTASDQVQGTNGVFVSNNQNDLLLNNDFTLQAGSPAIDAGRALIAGHPDSITEASPRDCGAIPLGGLTRFRQPERAFNSNLPSRWTSPGP